MTLQCLMCSSGQSKEELCKANPKLSGCEEPSEESEEPSESQEDVECPDEKYVNTSIKVKKADSKKISLVLKDPVDPVCECYDKCMNDEGDFVYWAYGVGKKGATCTCYGEGKKIKLKTVSGDSIIGYLTEEGKTQIEKKKGGRRRRERRTRAPKEGKESRKERKERKKNKEDGDGGN